MFDKKGEMKPLTIAIIAAVAILVLSAPARNWAFGLVGIGGTTPEPAATATGARCYVEDTTLTLGPAEEKFNPATKVTTDYHRLYKNGVDKGLYQDGSTITVNPGDKIAIYWTENSSSYYAAKQEFTIPCVGEVTAGEMPDSNAFQVYANENSLTVKHFSEDDGDLITLANNESLAAGDQVTIQSEIDGTFEDAYSPYGGIVIVVDGNGTTYDEFDIPSVTVNGVAGTVEKATVPNVYKSNTTDSDVTAFKIPGCISNCIIDFPISIEVASGVDPTAKGYDVQGITLTYYDEDWYQDTDTGLMELGVENNDNGEVGDAKFVSTITVA